MRGLGILLQYYFEARVLEAQRLNKADIAAQARQIKRINTQQQRLISQSKIIAKDQEREKQRRASYIKKIRQINNDKFSRWIDNFQWGLSVFFQETRLVGFVVILTFALSCAPYYFLMRYSLSKECLSLKWCKEISVKLWEDHD